MVESTPSTLIQYPGCPMKKYGTVPEGFGDNSGKNLYRLIWAFSRRVVLTGDPPMTVQMYVAVEPLDNPEAWIIEKWLPPGEMYEGSKQQWNRDPKMRLMGPYPQNGDYVMAATPLTCDPANASMDKLVAWIEAGPKRSRYENAVAIRDNIAAGRQQRRNIRKDMINNRMLPFGGEAYVSGAGAGRGTKTINLTRTANELGLPTKPGYAGASRLHKPVTYEVPNAGGGA